jgi:hypothetical protein
MIKHLVLQMIWQQNKRLGDCEEKLFILYCTVLLLLRSNTSIGTVRYLYGTCTSTSKYLTRVLVLGTRYLYSELFAQVLVVLQVRY